MKQRTILHEVSTFGKSLHSGQEVTLTFKPAPVDHGVVFRRVDLIGRPELKPSIHALGHDLVRNTSLSSGHIKLETVEHVLAAVNGMGVDNILIEMNASEPPILDGSAKLYVNLLQEAEITEQDKERKYFVLEEPVSITKGNRSLIALPYDGFKISCTSADDRGIHTQHLSIDIDPATFAAQIAPVRTFTIYEDIEPLLKMGKIQGGSLDSAIVIKGDKILSKEPLRFKDEFVRHKILDMVGDLALLGMPLKAHIVAVRPGHALNAELTAALAEKMEAKASGKKTKKPSPIVHVDVRKADSLNTRQLLNLLPHRYPFVMIDRVEKILNDDELIAIKNVTINENYFQGHFPGRPVMPGVLQLEAMAQAAGILMLRRVSTENKIALFMSADKVKFRQAVHPGDRLEIRVRLLKARGQKIGVAAVECTVDGKTVSSAELMFTVVDVGEEG